MRFLLVAALVATHLQHLQAQPCPATKAVVDSSVPSPLALYAARTTATARVYVADTAANACLGYVGQTSGAWQAFEATPTITYRRTPDRGTTRGAVLAALIARLHPPNVSSSSSGPASAPIASDSLFVATLTAYLAKVATIGDAQWQRTGTLWNADSYGGNYYDRCASWLAYAATPDAAATADVWRSRAFAMCDAYRGSYLAPNAWRASPHWGLVLGQFDEWRALHLAHAADSLAKADTLAKGLVTWANVMWAYNAGTASYVTSTNGENRILGRMLQAQTLARRMAEQTGDTAGARRYRAREDTAIGRAEAWIQPDGSYPAIGQVCGGQLNYMIGLHASYLIDVASDRPELHDRVLQLVRSAFSYLRATQLRADGSLNYASVDCTSKGVGAPTAAPDLDLFFVDGAWWLGEQTGDASWTAFGDALFADGVARAYWAGGKQYNEQLGFAVSAIARRRAARRR
jgi:hypothetical protein